MTISRRALLESAAATTVALSLPAQAATASGDATLNKAFDGLTDRLLSLSPEGATFLGLDKGARAGLKAKLDDRSWAANDTSHKMCAEWLGKLNAVPSTGLSDAAKLNKDVVVYALELGRDGGRFAYGDNTLESAMNESASPYVVSQETGNFLSVPEFLDSQHQIASKADADAYLARLEAFAVTLDQETVRVKHDVAAGICPPNFLLKTAIGQMPPFLATPAEKSRLVTSLATRAKAKGIAGDYAGMAAKIVKDKIYPAIHRQMDALNAAAKTATA
ncbi:MAG TPA: DUF885 family protein, partial [Rhizomicrobium sp.]|nr:DUF885 family protein [Rhizomicrobium sp.]